MGRALSDADVIARSLEQAERFGELFDRHHPVVHGYLRRRVGESLADDLAAEVFVRAFRGRARYRPATADARPWLLGIATKLVAGHRRAEGRALRAWERHAVEARTSAPDAIADRAGRELGRPLAAGLRRLSRRDREALLLLAWGELSYAEIAQALDIPVGTVRSRIHHARAQLADSLPPRPATLGEAHA
jgi:RNA polymerase sigma-70 factor (ECF subfamily)